MKVSIIVPVYNVEQYVAKCVESLQKQTYTNIEIILVDDGSTDSSGKLCDELAKTDYRIRVIHKKNGGLSSARNTGYKNASGEYLMYIDSDDVVKVGVVEKCVNVAQKEQSDVVIFGYEKISEEGQVLEICQWKERTYTHDEMVNRLYKAICEMSFGYAWNKLYRKEILDNSGILADAKIIDREDLVYNMRLLHHWEKISYINYVGYEYLQRSNSLLHNANLARLNGIEYFINQMQEIDVGETNINKKVYNMVILHYLSDCIIKNIVWNDELKRKEKKSLMKEVIERCLCKNKLYQDRDNGKHLQMLYKSIKTRNMGYFYWYVRLSDFKRKIGK